MHRWKLLTIFAYRQKDSDEDDDDDDSLTEHADADHNPPNAYKPNPLALILNTISNVMVKTALTGIKKNKVNSDDSVTEKALGNFYLKRVMNINDKKSWKWIRNYTGNLFI